VGEKSCEQSFHHLSHPANLWESCTDEIGNGDALVVIERANSRIVGYTEVAIPPVVHRYRKLGTRHVVYM